VFRHPVRKLHACQQIAAACLHAATGNASHARTGRMSYCVDDVGPLSDAQQAALSEAI